MREYCSRSVQMWPLVLFWTLLLMPQLTYAGDLDSPAEPTEPGSAMYTLSDIFHRLNTGADGSPTVYEEPVVGPVVGTGYTLNEIMDKAPIVDDVDGADAEHVLNGKTFWGLLSGFWGMHVGTMPNIGAQNITPSASAQTISTGYHNGSGQVAGDVDLVSTNIRSGVNLFGVAGDVNVVDTSSGDAVAADLRSGKKAWADGSEILGSLPTQTLSASSVNVQAGYYESTTLSTVDSDLVASNIKENVSLFGVTGTLASGGPSIDTISITMDALGSGWNGYPFWAQKMKHAGTILNFQIYAETAAGGQISLYKNGSPILGSPAAFVNDTVVEASVSSPSFSVNDVFKLVMNNASGEHYPLICTLIVQYE